MYRTVLYCVNWAQYRLDFSVFGIAHCQCLLTIILYKVSTVGGGALVPAAPGGGLAPIPPEPKGAPRVAQIMRWAWKKLVCLKSHTPKSPKTFLTVYCMLNMIGVLQVWGRRKRKKWRHFHRPPSNTVTFYISPLLEQGTIPESSLKVKEQKLLLSLLLMHQLSCKFIMT